MITMKTSHFALLVLLFSCQSKSKPSLTIATAANVQFAMTELTKAFQDQTGIACHIVIGSSGGLTAQIAGGAPYDVFVSANMKYPEALYKKGLTAAAPEVYGFGILVLWGTDGILTPSFNELESDTIRHIAIANPKTAPYGEAALEVLQNLNLLERINSKLVYGESISQVNQFVISNAAEIGFTSKSVVISDEMGQKGKWIEVDQQLYTPIAQGAVVIKGKNREMADKFYKFLFSEQAKLILRNYGYHVN